MVKQDKIFEVENLKAKIREAKLIAVVDYRGLGASQAIQLRNKIKEAGGELQVVKNTLFYRALKESHYQINKKALEGPSLALFSVADEISPLKTLAAFGKKAELLSLKIGFMNGSVYSAEELTRLSLIPGINELQTKLVGLLANQPSRLVYSLNWNLQKLVLVLFSASSGKK